jgi:hypothetical protein
MRRFAICCAVVPIGCLTQGADSVAHLRLEGTRAP